MKKLTSAKNTKTFIGTKYWTMTIAWGIEIYFIMMWGLGFDIPLKVFFFLTSLCFFAMLYFIIGFKNNHYKDACIRRENGAIVKAHLKEIELENAILKDKVEFLTIYNNTLKRTNKKNDRQTTRKTKPSKN